MAVPSTEAVFDSTQYVYTARESWYRQKFAASGVKLSPAAEAPIALASLYVEADIVILSGIPSWAVAANLSKLRLTHPVMIADWAGKFTTKAEACFSMSGGRAFAAIDDNPYELYRPGVGSFLCHAPSSDALGLRMEDVNPVRDALRALSGDVVVMGLNR
jgi:hypothetical protein